MKSILLAVLFSLSFVQPANALDGAIRECKVDADCKVPGRNTVYICDQVGDIKMCHKGCRTHSDCGSRDVICAPMRLCIDELKNCPKVCYDEQRMRSEYRPYFRETAYASCLTQAGGNFLWAQR